MNAKQSLERRRSSIIEEAQARGYEAMVFFNEVIRQNPSNTIYVMPGALGDEHQTLVLDADGDTTLVMPHWGAERVRAKLEEYCGEFEGPDIGHKLGVSIGIAGSEEYMAESKDMLTAADNAMYRAKDKGGNRCETLVPSPTA